MLCGHVMRLLFFGVPATMEVVGWNSGTGGVEGRLEAGRGAALCGLTRAYYVGPELLEPRVGQYFASMTRLETLQTASLNPKPTRACSVALGPSRSVFTSALSPLTSGRA